MATTIKSLTKKINLLEEEVEFWKKQSFIDELTNLENRASLNSKTNHLLEFLNNQKDGAKEFWYIAIDLDNFKTINDTHGHHAGDSCLQQVATILKSYSSENVSAFRIGGDEFIIIITLPKEKRRAVTNTVKKIQLGIRNIICGELRIDSSIGVTFWYPDKYIMEKHADVALYNSKNNKKGGIIYYSDISKKKRL